MNILTSTVLAFGLCAFNGAFSYQSVSAAGWEIKIQLQVHLCRILLSRDISILDDMARATTTVFNVVCVLYMLFDSRPWRTMPSSAFDDWRRQIIFLCCSQRKNKKQRKKKFCITNRGRWCELLTSIFIALACILYVWHDMVRHCLWHRAWPMCRKLLGTSAHTLSQWVLCFGNFVGSPSDATYEWIDDQMQMQKHQEH